MNRKNRRGFSLMELLIVVAILLIIGAIAVPRLGTARMQSQEMAAVRTIQTIHSAQAMYMSQFGRFATTLQELGPPASGGQGGAATVGPSGADLIQEDLAKGEKTGYKYILQGTPTGYIVNANPITPGTTGRRTFFSDQTLVIRENWGAEPASLNSKEIK
jgi:type IV pilus assembly protein PilA